MFQHLYSEFLKFNHGSQHFASHSHHYWPDVTKQAAIDYWEDSARFVDRKWEKILGTQVPRAQILISQVLKFSRPSDICFSSNTHDFLIRLLSTFNGQKTIRILTTDSEFYSFERQIQRLEETGWVEVTRLPTSPFESFEDRFSQALRKESWDLVFISHVFFNSGVAVRSLDKLVSEAPAKSLVVIDGYHSYFALPIDLSKLGQRAFFIAGGYKYAQSGEGCCFMTLPQDCSLRPAITGWFAEMGNLQNFGEHVAYSSDGYRFAGSTMDYSALYRMLSVLELFEKEKINVDKIHDHILQQQNYFLEALPRLETLGLNKAQILARPQFEGHGHFFTFELGSAEMCAKIHKALEQRKILTDYRKSRLRFGFGLYHQGPYNL